MSGLRLSDFRDAQAGLVGVAERTPLLTLPSPRPVRLKAEFRQPIGAFKIRGAWTAIHRLDPTIRARGVVTSSSGNHGLGVAYAAQRLGVPAVIVMPESAPAVKVAGVRALGGEVVLVGRTRGPEQTAAAEELVASRGLTFIPPYDHLDVITGQGTCALEILEDWPDVGTLVLPVGGGGLLAGSCACVRAFRPNIRVIAVEPAGLPKLSAARRAGHPVDLVDGTSLADGLLTRSVGMLTWPLIDPTVHEVVAVTDDEIRQAMRWLADQDIRVEPSGAVTTAAWLAGRISGDDPVALVATGGNVDPARYDELVG